MIRLLRTGQTLWQLPFGFDYPSGTPIVPPVIPPAVDQTGNLDYFRRYLADTPITVSEFATLVTDQNLTHEDIKYLRRYLCD